MPNYEESSKKVTNELELKAENGQVVVSSRVVSERFEKRHSDVLASIENITTENSVLIGNYFIPSTYKAGTGKNYPEYLLTKDGFTLLAMGFTGTKALEWKLKYIEAFNKMEQALKQPQLNHVADAINLINITKELMKEQGCESNDIALAVKEICRQFNINLPDCVVKPKTTLNEVQDMIEYIFNQPRGRGVKRPTYEDFEVYQMTIKRLN